MKINNINPNNQNQQHSLGKRGGVAIATNLKRERIVLDSFGNEIDLRSKQIIRKAEDN